MAANEYDLTMLKPSEYADGSGAAVVGDEFILIDASDDEKPVKRTLQDIVDLATSDSAEELNTYSTQVEVTLAEIKDGKILVAGVAGKQIVVTNFVVVPDGEVQTLTSIELEDETPSVEVCSIAQAGLSDNAVITPSHANVTLGVGMAEGLTAGEGLKLTQTGTDATNTTKVTVAVTYMLV